jgi:uncharacterized protein YdaU (DUF1376 family)
MSGGKPPAFMFYAADFAHDQNVELMDVAEVGAYLRLLCSAWTEGSIPSDLKQIARIAKVTPSRMIKLWPAIEICWKAVDGDPTKLVQKRMERVRADQEEHRRQKIEAGKAGARAKHYGKQDPPPDSGTAKVPPVANGQHKPGSASVSPQAEGEQNSGSANVSLVAKSSSSFSSSISSSYPESVVVPSVSPARARDLTPPTRDHHDEVIGDEELDLPRSALESVPDSVLEFGRWWVARGIELGGISDHYDLAPIDFCRKFGGLETAATFIAKYGIGPVKERSERIFKAAKDKKIAPNPGPSRLFDQWDKSDISGIPDTPRVHVAGQFDTREPLPKRGFELDKRLSEDVPVIGTPRTKCPACGASDHTEPQECPQLKKLFQKHA